MCCCIEKQRQKLITQYNKPHYLIQCEFQCGNEVHNQIVPDPIEVVLLLK